MSLKYVNPFIDINCFSEYVLIVVLQQSECRKEPAN